MFPNQWTSKLILTNISLGRTRLNATSRCRFTIIINAWNSPLMMMAWRLKKAISSWWVAMVLVKRSWREPLPNCLTCLLPLWMLRYLPKLDTWEKMWRAYLADFCRWPTMMWPLPNEVSSLLTRLIKLPERAITPASHVMLVAKVCNKDC